MREPKSSALIPTILCAMLLIGACGESGTGPAGSSGPEAPSVPEAPTEPDLPSPQPEPIVPGEPECADFYESTFEAIETIVFERRSCNAQQCHGSAAAGGLDLSPGVAYDNLYDQPGQISDMPLVQPGRTSNSLLFHKLGAATRPDEFEVAGTPMPVAAAPLSEDELELVRRWIYSGAPRDGVVETTVELIEGCLPPPSPITIEPLEPPPPGEGVQFVMPQFPLPAATETEVCFASYYDFSDQVPDEYLDPTGTYFRYRAFDMRQDPQSHHLILYSPDVPLDRIYDEAYGGWSCRGGARHGEACDPVAFECGKGICATAVRTGTCIGVGPEDLQLSIDPTDVQGFGGAQRAQLYTDFGEGVYAEVRVKGLVYWNSHAFNLTPEDHQMNARLNYLFAKEQNFVSEPFPIDFGSLYQAAGTAPFTEETYCNSMTFEKGTRITEITQHTHRFGRHFEAWLPDGTKIYENEVYNDPRVVRLPTPLAFDSDDPAERTIRFCGLFNNGVAPDGSPDPETVTRASRTPENQRRGGGVCTPTACAEGIIGKACSGWGDDATCDSSPGKGDGFCDACEIQAGVSTENSMFLLLGRFYLEQED